MSGVWALDRYEECGEGELVVEFHRGYSRCRTWPNGGEVRLHRLAAIAWFGWDAVVEKDVHHRVPVPWFNVESNLLPLPHPDHAHLTAKLQQGEVPETIVEDVLEGLGGGYGE